MRFTIPTSILARLRQERVRRPDNELQDREDAFLLFPGMGPALFLTADGRILKDARDWDESANVEEGSDDDAVAAIVIGAENWDIPELLSLLPEAPQNSRPCPQCGGSRWFSFRNYHGNPAKIICPECGGRGWTAKIVRDA